MRDLVVLRGAATPVALAARADAPSTQDTEPAPADAAGEVMAVRFSVFDSWYPVCSWYEGRFMEAVAPGAFSKTIAERGTAIKVLFNHGFDYHIGDKILGRPSLLEEQTSGPYMEVPLLQTSYNADLIPGLRVGGYGSSFMFHVLRDSWDYEPEASTYNPDALPERTIQEVRLLEAGPVTWPANPAATAGLRSLVDWYGERLRDRSPDQFRNLEDRYAAFRTEHKLRTPTDDAAPTTTNSTTYTLQVNREGTSTEGAAPSPTDAPDTLEVVHPTGLTPSARARVLAHQFL